jgi:hypothetical protein
MWQPVMNGTYPGYSNLHQGMHQPVMNTHVPDLPFYKMKGEFGDIIRSVLLSNSNAASPPSLLLGPSAGPISAIAGLALNAVARLCESIETAVPQSQGGWISATATEGALERAVVAEAALQAVARLPASKLLDNITQAMETFYHTLYREMWQLIPGLAPVIKDLAVHIASIAQQQEKKFYTISPSRGPARAGSAPQYLKASATRVVEPKHTSKFTIDSNSIIGTPSPLLGQGARQGLAKLGRFFSEDADSVPTDPYSSALHLLFQRAIVAEAALCALEGHNQALHKTKLLATTHEAEECFFKALRGIERNITARVAPIAPAVIDALPDIVLKAFPDASVVKSYESFQIRISVNDDGNENAPFVVKKGKSVYINL